MRSWLAIATKVDASTRVHGATAGGVYPSEASLYSCEASRVVLPSVRLRASLAPLLASQESTFGLASLPQLLAYAVKLGGSGTFVCTYRAPALQDPRREAMLAKQCLLR